MKNADKISLQKELEFYSNLIAEHERVNGKANFNSNNNLANVRNAQSYSKQARSNIITSSKKINDHKLNNFLQLNNQPSCSYTSNHFVKKPHALDNTLTTLCSKKSDSKFSLNCSSNKKLPNYSAKNQFSKPKNLKDSSGYTWHNSHMYHGKNLKSYSHQLPNVNPLNKNFTTKSCPEKLMGEILSVTKQLKMKSESLAKIKNKQISSNVRKSINLKSREVLPCIKKNTVTTKLSPKICVKKDEKLVKTNEVTKVPLANKIIKSTSKSNEKDTKNKATYSNMLENIKAIENKLSQAKKPSKLKIEKYRYKTSPLSKTFISRNHKNSFPIRKKVPPNHYLINKYSSPKSLTVKKNTPYLNQFAALHNSPSNVSKYTFSSLSNVPISSSKNANQLTSTYKIIKNVQTSVSKINSSRKSLSPKNIKKYKLNNSLRKKHIFKLVNENNITKTSTPVRNFPTSAETPLSAKFVSMYNEAAASSSLNSDVDLDLLLELASEQKPQKRIYRSKNTIINSYSAESRVAKMIKSKYFTKKLSARKNYRNTSKYFRGHFRNSPNRLHHYNKNVLKKSKYTSKNYVLNKYQSQSLSRQKKKIVDLGGEKFLVGSSGKTLKKISKSNPYYFRRPSTKVISPRLINLKMSGLKKNVSPVSKTLASRAVTRSIDTVLSASMKKKSRKFNVYCMFYNRFGRCNKGLKCSYVHDPNKIAVCTRFLRGTCKNEKCLFLHEVNPGKMAICSFFLRGSCTKNDCPYRHEQLKPYATLCKDFVQGFCPNGKECLKAHVLLCHKNVQGLCKKGNNCSFIHTLTQENIANVKNDVNSEKSEDLTLDTLNRYFECNSQGASSAKGNNLVIPRLKCLPEQPSFIALKMDESL